MTEEQAKTATLDELRDWLVVDDGWNYTFRHRHASGASQFCWITKGGRETFDHPHPPTLDGAAAALPEGWRWQRWGPYYSARRIHLHAMIRLPVGSRLVEVNDTGDEIADRYRLAVLCRLAEKAVAK